jgi:hypothetical protein
LALALRKEYRLKMTENKVLWEIFGSKGDAVTGNWRKMQNVELNKLEMEVVCSTYFGEEKCIQAVGWEI